MKTEKRLSIVIISRNTRELLSNLLDSIKKDTSLTPYISDVILVDNASTDGTEELVKDAYKWVSYLRNERNAGFAKAVNVGITRSSGEFILLLNSDTLLIEGEMLRLMNFMKVNAETGICGPQLVYPDMKPQRSFAHRPSLLLEIIPKPLLEFISPQKYASRNYKYSEPFEVDSLIGAAIMIARKAIELAGRFDERFFFFLEETDFCIRVKEKGQSIMFFPLAKIIHLQGKTVKQSWVEGRIEYNISLHKFIKKHHSAFYYFIFSFVRILKFIPSLIVYSVLPFLLISEKTRIKYQYYFRLLIWHISGHPEKGGIEH